jgi:hypothetical protein
VALKNKSERAIGNQNKFIRVSDAGVRALPSLVGSAPTVIKTAPTAGNLPSQTEIRQQITNQIIRALKSGKLPPWRKPWSARGC